MPMNLNEIEQLFRVRGPWRSARQPVTLQEHALQCAWLAEEAGEAEPFVAAALLHDIGHLLVPPEADDNGFWTDNLHQHVALSYLRGLLPDPTLELIRMHVDAKRCLCATDTGYWDRLSPWSKLSLVPQGGAMSRAEVEAFRAHPLAQAALRLRRYDDRAQMPGRITRSLDWYMDKLAALEVHHPALLQQKLDQVRAPSSCAPHAGTFPG